MYAVKVRKIIRICSDNKLIAGYLDYTCIVLSGFTLIHVEHQRVNSVNIPFFFPPSHPPSLSTALIYTVHRLQCGLSPARTLNKRTLSPHTGSDDRKTHLVFSCSALSPLEPPHHAAFEGEESPVLFPLCPSHQEHHRGN